MPFIEDRWNIPFMVKQGAFVYTNCGRGYRRGTLMPTELIDLLEKADSYLPKQKIRLIQRAYRFAEEKHSGQTRLTGAP